MDKIHLRPITWVKSSLDDLKKMPVSVQREIGFSLHQVQEGKTPYNAKTLTKLGSGILEIISDYNKNTYRAVYAVKLDEDIYVLHVFQKKSKRKIETPKQEIDLIKQRIIFVKQKINKQNKSI